MEQSEFQKIVEEFTAKLKPVTPEMLAIEGISPEEVPVAVAPGAPPAEEVEACITRDFKKMVGVLPPDYIGKDGKDIKELVVAFLDSLPECKE